MHTKNQYTSSEDDNNLVHVVRMSAQAEEMGSVVEEVKEVGAGKPTRSKTPLMSGVGTHVTGQCSPVLIAYAWQSVHCLICHPIA